jgi:hypothetical protein
MAMRRYRVIGKTTCYVCVPKRERIIDDSEIQANDDNGAKEALKVKHKLCSFCLEAETKAAVEFDAHIYVEWLPST